MTNRARLGLLLLLGASAAVTLTSACDGDRPPKTLPSSALMMPRVADAPQQRISRSLSPATTDPFEATAPPPPAKPKSAVVEAPPPPPPPPPMNWRYVGQMTAPDNKRQVFLARGERTVSIETGQRLDDGFVVDDITTENLRLRHLDSGVVFLIALPESPPQDAQ